MATTSASPVGRLPIGARRRTEDLLCRIGAYRPARNAYQALFNRQHWSARRRDRAFFGQFVSPGALVFDVGANEGRVTETFAELGASVVAVEPNPSLARRVRRRYGSARVTVEAVAVGAQDGVGHLHLGRDNGHSTLSADWQGAIGAAAGANRWEGSVEVPVTTLDALISRFGMPAFVKIDVEGFEPAVLAGLHHPVPSLSFEFLCAAIDLARRCVATIGDLGPYEFNVALGERHELNDHAWMTAPVLLAELEALRLSHPDSYGDVYARLVRT
ncbi:MAG TPA: FkbM family methyltransferase [Thermoleophilaceae bacterium]|nr:FkbM family methyltransferase [Thermoleophilaceae bacterium]